MDHEYSVPLEYSIAHEYSVNPEYSVILEYLVPLEYSVPREYRQCTSGIISACEYQQLMVMLNHCDHYLVADKQLGEYFDRRNLYIRLPVYTIDVRTRCWTMKG